MLTLDPCDNPLCSLTGLGETIGGTINFWQDPAGNTFQMLKDAASGLAQDVLPALGTATMPDLSAEWFLNAYAISFAGGILVAIVLLLPQFVRVARGTMAGRDLLDSIVLFWPAFMIGAMFGPMFGILLVQFFHALSTSVMGWGIAGNYAEVVDTLVVMIERADPAGITGGVFIGIILMLCMVVGLFLVVLMLIVQLVTLYFTGILAPLVFAWVTTPNGRDAGFRIGYLWLGILAAHPLLFFLLGSAYGLMASNVTTLGEKDALQALVTFIVSLLAIYIAALAPLMLLKFAPIPMPAGVGGTNGPTLNGQQIGPASMTEATNRYADQPVDAATSPQPAMSETTAADVPVSELGGADGGGLSDVAAAQTGPAGAVGEAGATGAAGLAGAEGGTAAAATGAASTAGAAETVAAAGAAESATGVGAAIGVPTLIAAAGLKAAEAGQQLGNAAAEQAVEPMEDGVIGGSRP
ncbi:hypothetical protein [Agromyces bracchium]|uniref:Uncharacterized protein n=1 Tax=Agromyces bracchium TaxID=88376 RepID=A0A6I3M9J5_9MICO|nr:hypothetical protein [Agromyces bracchium]MTH69458.1 hypothetical protein [Agromyces bracchium]